MVQGMGTGAAHDSDRISGQTDSESYAAWVDEATRLCSLSEEIETVPCVVLDPFVGSGTAMEVALDHGRYCWGVDLSEGYLRKNAIPRIERWLLQRPTMAHLAGIEREAVEIGTPVVLARLVDMVEGAGLPGIEDLSDGEEQANSEELQANLPLDGEEESPKSPEESASTVGLDLGSENGFTLFD
jgi:hypothetical protein